MCGIPSMIHIKDLCLSFGNQCIFKNISCTIHPHERIGLVGMNGTGKSTLLRIIARLQEPDSGTIHTPSSFTIGYMPQELTLTSKNSILQETITSKYVDDETLPLLEIEAKKVLYGLGFTDQQCDQPVSQLSTGWKMRVLLAQLLLKKADFYLFDEPTNHLDLLAQEWFFDVLKNAPYGFMLVSHDRYYLDHVCTKIIELEHGNATRYNGNYTDYRQQKEERAAIIRATYENQQKEIAHKERTINRFRAKASKARMVKKMEKELDRIDRITIQDTPPTVNIQFPQIRPSGKEVLEVKHLSFSFEEKQIFDDANFLLTKNERVAIVAPNGTGKTTLLNLIVGKYKPHTGTISQGYHVTTAYFEQDQLETFHPEKTIFETVQERTTAQDQTIRTILGSFLFSQELIHKKIKVLSGGEKNRVNMVCTLLQHANTLFLDEPTNHLDIYSKEILLNALNAYQGTILFVSHDHNFVNGLATGILEIHNQKLAYYHGNYQSYLDQKKSHHDETTVTHTQQTNTPKKHLVQKNALEHKKRTQRLESTIQRLEKNIETLSSKLHQHEYGSSQYLQLFNELQKKQTELETHLHEWENLIA
jgi:ATP-binding cassette, subfamily F, member 3